MIPIISRDDLPETPEWQPDPHEWDETAYLMASPANAERLRASIQRNAEWSLILNRPVMHKPALEQLLAEPSIFADPHACPFDPCFVCQPHEGGGTYPPLVPPNVVLGSE